MPFFYLISVFRIQVMNQKKNFQFLNDIWWTVFSLYFDSNFHTFLFVSSLFYTCQLSNLLIKKESLVNRIWRLMVFRFIHSIQFISLHMWYVGFFFYKIFQYWTSTESEKQTFAWHKHQFRFFFFFASLYWGEWI